MADAKAAKTIGNRKVLVVPRTSDPTGFMSLDLTSSQVYASLQTSHAGPAFAETKSIKRIVQKSNRPKRQPSECLFDSGRVRTSVEQQRRSQSKEKLTNSEVVRKSHAYVSKAAR